MKTLKRIYHFISGTKAATLYMLLFAMAIGIATFIENDFGTDAAQKHIYKALWFEILLFLFALSLFENIRKYQFIKRKKWTLLLFHSAIIVILLGAGITRYVGFEGIMPIREGQTSNVFLSAESYVNLQIEKDGQKYEVSEPVLFSSLGKNKFAKEYKLGSSLLQIELKDFVPNPIESITAKGNKNPALRLVIGGPNGREEFVLKQKEQRNFLGQEFGFNMPVSQNGVEFSFEGGKYFLLSSSDMTCMTMATQEKKFIPAGEKTPIQTRSLYQGPNHQFVISEVFMAGDRILEAGKQKIDNSSTIALQFEVSYEGQKQAVWIEGMRGNEGMQESVQLENLNLNLSYGAKRRELPFALKLNYFRMTRYPGTNSPESFLSNVTLKDPEEGYSSEENIYMNNILDYKGYRFFQSSYDQDEKGTYLSVNHDFWGTWISYFGYFLLALGMFLTLFDKGSRFRELQLKFKESTGKFTVLIALIFSSSILFAQDELLPTMKVVPKEHAQLFSRLQVQDIRGRIKPIHTLSREVLRKIHGSETFGDYSADQILLSMAISSNDWVRIPFIKIGSNEKLQTFLNVRTNLVSYADFFDAQGNYKLGKLIQAVNVKAEKDRTVYDKLLLNVDERVNIMNMALSGLLLRIVPVKGDPNNTWVSNHNHGDEHEMHDQLAEAFFERYYHEVQHGLQDGNFLPADKLVLDLQAYQVKTSPSIVLSSSQLNVEIILNKSKIFNRLAFVYSLLGILFLTWLFVEIFRPNWNITGFTKWTKIILFVFVVLHALALLARWYVSGHAPWSNGYESMIYISWTTLLAGVLFARKTMGGLAATSILAGVLLLIALLSYMNPEITPLVPVLKSYWLSIHVSMEAGSYGFLMLGAVIGIINLLVISFMRQSNKDRSIKIVKELTFVSEMTLIAGLFMLSIGTFLGGIWANESWGRYWGWDAKETWALVSILVYAVILHLRLIPKMNGVVLFNALTLFGLASIIMTYYGVNYYLSGLHSYAAGDPLPVPSWVYLAIIGAVSLVFCAFWKKRKMAINLKL